MNSSSKWSLEFKYLNKRIFLRSSKRNIFYEGLRDLFNCLLHGRTILNDKVPFGERELTRNINEDDILKIKLRCLLILLTVS